MMPCAITMPGGRHCGGDNVRCNGNITWEMLMGGDIAGGYVTGERYAMLLNGNVTGGDVSEGDVVGRHCRGRQRSMLASGAVVEGDIAEGYVAEGRYTALLDGITAGETSQGEALLEDVVGGDNAPCNGKVKEGVVDGGTSHRRLKREQEEC